MKVRSPATGTAQAAGGAGASAAGEAKARGQKLLEKAATGPLGASTLGVSQGSVDALSRSLLEGALLALERRAPASDR